MQPLMLLVVPVISAKTLYVSPQGANIAPYATLEEAALTLQAAVDEAVTGDLIYVDQGTYQLSAIVRIDKALTMESLHGATLTTVKGSGSEGCFSIEAEAVLIGFTIRGGRANAASPNDSVAGWTASIAMLKFAIVYLPEMKPRLEAGWRVELPMIVLLKVTMPKGEVACIKALR